MTKFVRLSRGLDINLAGKAEKTKRVLMPGEVYALTPSSFEGVKPKVMVKEGDRVKAGDVLFINKDYPEVGFSSPVSGEVCLVERGDRRKLLSVRVKADANQEFVDFGVKNVKEMTGDDVEKSLLEAGLFGYINQLPYAVSTNPQTKPKAIFVSALRDMPLAGDFEFELEGQEKDFQTGLTALSKMAKTYLGVGDKQNISAADVEVVTFKGKCPAGNVGVQIHHISPIRKGETVWTVSMVMLAAIGKLFRTGKYDVRRKIAITGPRAVEPAYVSCVPGMAMKEFAWFYSEPEKLRFISGDALSGTSVGKDGFLGFYDNQVTILKEGNEYEMFGWAKPFRTSQFSSSRTYFSWLTPKKVYDMDTNLHGGPRAFVMSDGYYSKYLPMDIYPIYLAKACLAGDIEKMEKFGIYEVLPEDLAICEYVDPSKNYIQEMIAKGIDLMLKEMA